MIEMFDVWKAYPNGVYALKGINIQINAGDFVYIVGPSGAGKSTFIKLMYREERPTKGQVFFNGQNLDMLKWRKIPKLRRNIGIVFQDYKLLPNLDVFDNVAFAMKVTEASGKAITKRVTEVLDLVGLRNKMDVFPNQLSGGEQQRVAIARALVNNPNIIIADEPTGNLDQDTSWGIMDLLDKINARGTTVIMATHNKEIVNVMKRRVIEMDDGQIIRDEMQGGYGYEI